jgi:hypothetical protein
MQVMGRWAQYRKRGSHRRGTCSPPVLGVDYLATYDGGSETLSVNGADCPYSCTEAVFIGPQYKNLPADWVDMFPCECENSSFVSPIEVTEALFIRALWLDSGSNPISGPGPEVQISP